MFDIETLKIEAKERNNRRTKAFRLISGKDKIRTELEKTKICRNIEQFGNCPYKTCYYAHSKDELKIPLCLFGDFCDFRYSKTHPCQYIHPGETVSPAKNKVPLFERKEMGNIDDLLNKLKNECNIEDKLYERKKYIISCKKEEVEEKLHTAFRKGNKNIVIKVL